jgi:Tfp pilus assembly protein PilF
LEISAVAASMKKEHDRAIELMKQATVLEEAMGPPSGPPGIIKPSHELLGEILLRAGKPEAAAEMFQVALLRQPNRARSLLGAARAAVASGNKAAARSFYTTLLEQWQQADEGLPELREVRAYLKQ